MDFDYDYLSSIKQKNIICQEFSFVNTCNLGKSVMGKDIFALSIGDVQEKALFVGGFHGTDRFSSLILTTFFIELCKAIRDDSSIEGMRVNRALAGRGLTVIPCINPDGCEIAAKGKTANEKLLPLLARKNFYGFKSFRTNARGLDIHKNFGGKTPFSEPESIALRDFCMNGQVRHAVIFGSGENKISSPFGESVPERSRRMADIMAASTGYNSNGEKDCFIEWFVRSVRRPAFKILSDFSEQSDAENKKQIYRELREVLMLSAIM